MHQISLRGKRIVGRFKSNEDCVSALTKLCESRSIRAGEVRLSGALKSVELARFDAEARDYVKSHHGGPVEIVTLRGSVGAIGDQVALRLDALLSAESGFGAQLVSGQLRRGVVDSCEFVLDVFEDLEMKRALEPQSGRLELVEVARTEAMPEPGDGSSAQVTPPPTQPSLSWGEVSAASDGASAKPRPVASTRRPEPPAQAPSHSILESNEDDFDEDEERPEMKPGDMLEHPKLGRCRIMKVEEDDYAHIRLPRGKISKLVLDIFDIHYKGEENGRNVYTLRMRK